jgi:hypothetical protein
MIFLRGCVAMSGMLAWVMDDDFEVVQTGLWIERPGFIVATCMLGYFLKRWCSLFSMHFAALPRKGSFVKLFVLY